jgi:hypothetical protein
MRLLLLGLLFHLSISSLVLSINDHTFYLPLPSQTLTHCTLAVSMHSLSSPNLSRIRLRSIQLTVAPSFPQRLQRVQGPVTPRPLNSKERRLCRRATDAPRFAKGRLAIFEKRRPHILIGAIQLGS